MKKTIPAYFFQPQNWLKEFSDEVLGMPYSKYMLELVMNDLDERLNCDELQDVDRLIILETKLSFMRWVPNPALYADEIVECEAECKSLRAKQKSKVSRQRKQLLKQYE